MKTFNYTVTHDNITYPGLKLASIVLGMSRTRVSYYVNKTFNEAKSITKTADLDNGVVTETLLVPLALTTVSVTKYIY